MKIRMSYIVKLFPAASQFLFTNFDNNELTFKRLSLYPIILSTQVILYVQNVLFLKFFHFSYYNMQSLYSIEHINLLLE